MSSPNYNLRSSKRPSPPPPPRTLAQKITDSLPRPFSEFPADPATPAAADTATFVARSPPMRHAELLARRGRTNLTCKKRAVKLTQIHIPRSLNSFQLYRRAYHDRALAFARAAAPAGTPAAELASGVLSAVQAASWRREKKAVKKQFTEWAKLEKEAHAAAFPEDFVMREYEDKSGGRWQKGEEKEDSDLWLEDTPEPEEDPIMALFPPSQQDEEVDNDGDAIMADDPPAQPLTGEQMDQMMTEMEGGLQDLQDVDFTQLTPEELAQKMAEMENTLQELESFDFSLPLPAADPLPEAEQQQPIIDQLDSLPAGEALPDADQDQPIIDQLDFLPAAEALPDAEQQQEQLTSEQMDQQMVDMEGGLQDLQEIDLAQLTPEELAQKMAEMERALQEMEDFDFTLPVVDLLPEAEQQQQPPQQQLTIGEFDPLLAAEALPDADQQQQLTIEEQMDQQVDVDMEDGLQDLQNIDFSQLAPEELAQNMAEMGRALQEGLGSFGFTLPALPGAEHQQQQQSIEQNDQQMAEMDDAWQEGFFGFSRLDSAGQGGI